MWSAKDVARASVRRQGAGLSADKVAEAARRERETQEQVDSPVDPDGAR